MMNDLGKKRKSQELLDEPILFMYENIIQEKFPWKIFFGGMVLFYPWVYQIMQDEMHHKPILVEMTGLSSGYVYLLLFFLYLGFFLLYPPGLKIFKKKEIVVTGTPTRLIYFINDRLITYNWNKFNNIELSKSKSNPNIRLHYKVNPKYQKPRHIILPQPKQPEKIYRIIKQQILFVK